MADCKACGGWFSSTAQDEICPTCQRALKRLNGYAAPVVHGRWEKEDQSGISIDGYMVCSACNVMIPKPDDNRYCLHRLNFCPNCGADMRGDRDGRKDP